MGEGRAPTCAFWLSDGAAEHAHQPAHPAKILRAAAVDFAVRSTQTRQAWRADWSDRATQPEPGPGAMLALKYRFLHRRLRPAQLRVLKNWSGALGGDYQMLPQHLHRCELLRAGALQPGHRDHWRSPTTPATWTASIWRSTGAAQRAALGIGVRKSQRLLGHSPVAAAWRRTRSCDIPTDSRHAHGRRGPARRVAIGYPQLPRCSRRSGAADGIRTSRQARKR